MIPHILNETVAMLAPAIANHLWQSTLFAAVAAALTLVLRKNQARARYWLWMAASVKFLVPFSLLVELGAHFAKPQYSPAPQDAGYFAVREAGVSFANQIAPAVSPVAISTNFMSITHLLPLLLALVWLSGSIATLTLWCVRWRRIAASMRNAVEVGEGRELEALRRLESAGGLRTRIALRLSDAAMEPGIFGITRPVLAWPERISARLDDAHLEAILAHEVCHVRRRDNLTAAIHMFVEAACWFHPMVWWMGARLVEERERACDEEVLELCAQPEIYAQSILKVCEFCVESPLPCVSGVTGADLKKRIVQIMTDGVARRLNFGRKALLATLAFAAIAGPVLFGVVRLIPMYGQMFHASGPLPSYEVVVIKPAKDDANGASTSGEQTHYLVTAKMLIQFAYGVYNPPRVLDLDVVGGPDWINSDVFDIVGKMDSTEFEQEQKMGRLQKHERRQMMEQSLLADRFKLRMHAEMRDKPVYALTVIKGGPKMAPAKDITGGAHVNPSPGSMTPEELHRGLIVRAKGHGFEMTVKGMTLETFVDALMMQKETSGKSVVNQTGLTGAYDFTLVWGPEDTAAPDSGEAAGAEEPPLMTAIRQQLGLKLVPSKGPAEVLVIDHVAKPEMDRVEPQQPAPATPKPVALRQDKNIQIQPRSHSSSELLRSSQTLPMQERPIVNHQQHLTVVPV